MADIRITPGSSIMNFTSSLNYVETLKQDASGSLNLYGSGSTGRTELFSIDGNNGRLFTVSDDLSDSLFSVNTIAGLPVIEAFANNTVVMGQYGTNALVVSGSNVGIGTTSPSEKLDVNGSIKATSFFESSLRKYKTNIKKFDKSGIDLVDSLEIVTFDRIDSDVKSKIGIIADDTSDEFLSNDQCAVDLYKTVFIQAKAIQELKSEVDELKEELNNLRELVISNLNK